MGGAWPILFGSSVGVAIYSHAGIVDFDPGERRTRAPCCRPETDRGKRVFFIYGVLFALHFHEWKHGSDAGSRGLGKKIVYLKYFWEVTRHPRLAVSLCTIQGQITVSIASNRVSVLAAKLAWSLWRGWGCLGPQYIQYIEAISVVFKNQGQSYVTRVCYVTFSPRAMSSKQTTTQKSTQMKTFIK